MPVSASSLTRGSDPRPIRAGFEGPFPWKAAGDDRLLLVAATASPERAAEAWSEWKARTASGSLPPGGLLALAYHRLHGRYPEDAALEQGRTAFLEVSRRNQIREALLSEVIDLLASHGIATVVLAGMALAVRHYRSLGARDMRDVDLFVLPTDVPLAIDVLAGAGWTPDEAYVLRDRREMTLRHACPLTHRTGERLDLHWRPFAECLQPAVVDECWRDAEAVTIGTSPSAVLQPTDQLVHTCVQAVSAGATPQWIPDALVVLASEPIDWTRMAAVAATLSVRVRLHLALDYLRREFSAAVPDSALDALDARSAPSWEWAESRLSGRTLPLGLADTVRWHWYGFLRASAIRGTARSPSVFGFARHVRTWLGAAPGPRVAAFIEARARRLRARLGRGRGGSERA